MGQEAPMTHILDAGPLIAALNRTDRHHRWARETIAHVGPPFHSCPEAMAEAAAMTGRPAAIVEMIQAGEIVLAFDLAEQAASVLALLNKYADRDMDLADACIVRMTELVRDCRVLTLDRSDFSVYRRNGRDLIPIIAPPTRRARP
jgi:predicted nucleic acid-binding protein